MRLLFPKGFKVELKMPNGIDGEAEGYYEEQIDKEEVIKVLGDSWEEQLKEQLDLMASVLGSPVVFDKEHGVITYSFDGLKGKDALNMVVGEFIGNTEFARMSLAELMALTTYKLAQRKADKIGK